MTKPSKEVKAARKQKLLEPSNQTLYRFFNANNELLYVGITNNPFGRLSGHSGDKDWFKELHHATFEHFDNRLEVDRAETRAIVNEKPKYNKAKNPDWESPADHYRSLKRALLGNKTIPINHEKLLFIAKDVYTTNQIKGIIAASLYFAIHYTKIDCELCKQIGSNNQYKSLATKITI